MLSNKILEKLNQKQELTSEEISYVIKEIIRMGDLELEQVPISDSKKCNEAERAILKWSLIFDLEYIDFSTRVLNNENLFHKFGLVVFNRYTHPITYLVDLTYEQFEKEEEYKDFYISEKFGIELSSKLTNQKCLPFTKENFEEYITAFEKASNINDNRLLICCWDRIKAFGLPINYNIDSEFYFDEGQLTGGSKGVKL